VSQFVSLHRISLRYLSVAFIILGLGLLSGLFAGGFETKLLHVFLISALTDMSPMSESSSLKHINNIKLQDVHSFLRMRR